MKNKEKKTTEAVVNYKWYQKKYFIQKLYN